MTIQKTVMVGDIPFGGDNAISFILGPCQLETRDHAMFMAERLVNAFASSVIKRQRGTRDIRSRGSFPEHTNPRRLHDVQQTLNPAPSPSRMTDPAKIMMNPSIQIISELPNITWTG